MAQIISGDSLPNTIRIYLRTLMSKPLVMTFSWSGRGIRKSDRKNCFRSHWMMDHLMSKFSLKNK